VVFDFYLPHYSGTVIRHDGVTPVGSLLGLPEIGDVNGDGKADLAARGLFDFSVTVSLGRGDGTFRSGITKTLATQPTDVSLVDLDGDGDREVVVLHLSAMPGVGSLAWQSVSLGGEAMVPGSNPGSFSAPADLNGDGKPDLATCPYPATALSILLGNGAGGLVAGDPVSAGDQIVDIAAGDVDGDGRVDLITRGADAGTVRFLRNAPSVVVARR
ncbi:MAG TPA: VCBS repeat-containing protein, partial [Candidatus Binatia bacterium]|nr:VCBS repeat-containing protein [Candidatus Binatia bacterium]